MSDPSHSEDPHRPDPGVIQPPLVALQGELGSFSHEAARQLFGADVAVLACRDFDALIDAVRRREAERGVIPVENTLAGSVPRNLDRIRESGLDVVGETRVRVELCLIGRPGATLAGVTGVASHPVALEQCRAFLAAHPAMVARNAYDTAGSVRDLMADGTDDQAAIASALAAELYGAEVLARAIEDDAGNFTRFFEVRQRGEAPHPEAPAREADAGAGLKAVVAFVLPHRPGSLHAALGRIAAVGADLSRLESRPIAGRPWEYRFYADVRGTPAVVRAAVDELVDEAAEATVLGIFTDRSTSIS